MRDRIILVSILFFAAFVRVLYWIHVYEEAWFIAPGMDPAFYKTWADTIIAGNGSDYIPFPRAPLYPYLLALIHKIFGDGWLVALMLNLIAELLTVILLFRFTRKIANLTIASVVGTLYALSGAAIYYSGETLMTSLATLLSVVFVYSTAKAWKKPTASNVIMSGVFLALLSLYRPNAFIILPFTGLIFAFTVIRQGETRLKALRKVTIHWMAAIIILFPVTIANHKASGQFIPISTQGGVNFYIGNAQYATGWASIFPKVGGNWTDEDVMQTVRRDIIRRPMASPYQAMTMHIADGHLWKMGWREIASDPVAWLKLMMKKILLLVDAREIGNNRPLLLATDGSWLLRPLMWVSLGLMLPFALLGAVSNYKLPEVKALLLFMALFGGSLLLFFVNSRYRMPLVPLMSVLAGLGIKRLVELLLEYRKNKTLNRLHVVALAVLSIGVLLSLSGWINNDWSNRAQAAFVHGNSLMRLDRPYEAVTQYRKAATMDSSYPELNLNLGAALLGIGDTTEAKSAFQRELESDPDNGKAWNNLGVIAESREDYERAKQCYLAAIQVSDNLDAEFNLARIYMKFGDFELQKGEFVTAEEYYQQALFIEHQDAKLYYRIALVRASKGDVKGALKYAQTTLKIDPQYDSARQLLESIR